MKPADSPLRILALEPWLGGSHRAFLEAWSARSQHEVQVLGLKDEHWKWRMSAGSWELARGLAEEPLPDLIFASDYLDLPAFLGHAPAGYAKLPTLVYFHENQITYPVPDEGPGKGRDHQYGFTNIMSCVRAGGLAFNSAYHLEEFAGGALRLLQILPKPNPRRELEAALESARIIAPGIDLEAFGLGSGAPSTAPLRVLFNHRWEHDKAPAAFLSTVLEVLASGTRLELVLLGETYAQLPPGCEEQLAQLEPVTLQRGFADSREHYAELIASCDVVVSTALHEFFGMSVLEAMACGATPLLPNRLSYPGLFEAHDRQQALYADERELRVRLVELAADPARTRSGEERKRWRTAAERWSADRTAKELDSFCAELAARPE